MFFTGATIMAKNLTDVLKNGHNNNQSNVVALRPCVADRYGNLHFADNKAKAVREAASSDSFRGQGHRAFA